MAQEVGACPVTSNPPVTGRHMGILYLEGLLVYVSPCSTADVRCRKRRCHVMSCAVGCTNRFYKNNKTC